MGLLPSSRRRQSCDLRDSAAADDRYIYLNGHDAGRRGRSRKGSYPHNTVRLVRSRTLSSNVDGEGPTGGPDSWMGPGSPVLQNGGVNGERELKKLLADTRPVARWQERLKRLLRDYIMPDQAFLALGFLEKNMDTAIIAVEDPSQSLGFPALFIDIKHKPQIFNLQHWKDIMIALHFDITEPEGNTELDLVEVKVTRQVTLGSLLGFKFFSTMFIKHWLGHAAHAVGLDNRGGSKTIGCAANSPQSSSPPCGHVDSSRPVFPLPRRFVYPWLQCHQKRKEKSNIMASPALRLCSQHGSELDRAVPQWWRPRDLHLINDRHTCHLRATFQLFSDCQVLDNGTEVLPNTNVFHGKRWH